MFVWYIDTITINRGHYYRYHVEGSMSDPDPRADYDGRAFIWTIPTLKDGGARFAFRMRLVE
jgi:hypothetical protein